MKKTDNKWQNFEMYVHRRHLARFIVRYELFKKILDVKGSIIECGVYEGGGLLGWAKLSSILEPYALNRKIIGFDTFEGFPEISKKDNGKGNQNLRKGAFKTDDTTYENILLSIDKYNNERYLNNFDKIELVKGDAVRTIPNYLKKNKHLIIALLFMDFDLYEPTKVALETFLPRIPKGGIIAFDQVNNSGWAGETIALVEKWTTLNQLEIKKYHFDTNIAYIVL